MIAPPEEKGHNFTLSGIEKVEIKEVTEAPVEVVYIPPQNAPIDPDTMRRLIDVRTTILRGGIYGMLVGSTIGFVFHIGINRLLMRTGRMKRFSLAYPSLRIPHRFPKNSLLPTVLIVGSFVSFTYASMSGRTSLDNVGDIWSANAKPKSEYQQQMNQNKQLLHKSQDEAFDRRTSTIKETKAIKEELEKWGPLKK